MAYTNNRTQHSICCAAAARSAPSMAATPATEDKPAPRNDVGIAGRGLRPALLARYRDLSQLRYDYPLVLGEGEGGVRPLVEVFNELAARIAPAGPAHSHRAGGPEGERRRRHTLRLEAEIRDLVARGERATLGRLWQLARARLLDGALADEREALAASMAEMQASLLPEDRALAESPVIDCSPKTATQVVKHIWLDAERRRLAPLAKRLRTLIRRLTDILEADWARSSEAREPEAVAASLGSVDAVDPAALSQLLSPMPSQPLPASRAARIRLTLETLRYQRFVAMPQAHGVRQAVHPFAFDSCAAALTAYERRLPELVTLIRAMKVAELEIENGYQQEHDAYFAQLDLEALAPEELAQFPTYLVRLRSAELPEVEKALLLDALASRLPLKLLVEHDDLLGSGPHAPGRCGPDAWGARLGLQALGLASAFVLQAPSSHLPTLAARIESGLARRGPAMLSVYVGRQGADTSLPSYLQTAAALQARAFPAFVYDPEGGEGLAARFDISANPQPGKTWPVTRIEGADASLQRFTRELPFTWADLAACDPRCAEHFLALDEPPTNGHATHTIQMVDDTNVLQPVLAGPEVREGARRCAERWRAVQELAGVNCSLVERALAEARKAWEAERADAPTAAAPAAGAATVTEQAPAAEQPPAPVIADGEPYIETWRCTSCNECIGQNPKMFVYDDNKQAQIVDPSAGTYRQLVEAAERCQLALIHPGEPKNPDEPDLDALRARAKPFNVPPS